MEETRNPTGVQRGDARRSHAHPHIADLRRYVKHCHAVVRDISHVLSDQDARQDLWTIQYAVDFSEIFSFTLPELSSERSPVADGWGEDPELQFFVLSRFLSKGDIILPEPYALELHGFMESLLGNAYGQAAKLLLDAMESLKKVLSGKAATDIARLASLNRPLTENETKTTIAFFEAQAPALVAFVRGADLPSVDRLKRLLRKKPFVDLEKIAPGIADSVDVDRIDRMKDFLMRGRNGTPQSDYNDALALEQIRVANAALSSQRKRILLVSRSPAMMRACQRYAEPANVLFIRHPRIFSTAYMPEKGHDERSLADLRRRRQSLQLFIRAAQESLRRFRQNKEAWEPEEDAPTSPQIVEAEQQLEKMRKNWLNVEGLSAAFVAKGELEIDASTSERSPTAIAHRLLEFLRDDKRNIAQYAKLHIRNLIEDVRRQRDRLGVKLHSAVAVQAEYLSILYPIHFQTIEIDDYVAELARHWSVNLDAASKLVETAAYATDAEYEQLVAMSVCLGILGQWEVAEKYAEYALQLGGAQQRDATNIEEQERREDIARLRGLHEGHFWHAVCLRKNSPRDETPMESVKRIKAAIAEIAAAESLRLKTGESEPDARYLKEEAALLLEWRQIASSPENDSLRKSRPSPAAIVERLNLAWDTTGDVKLRAQINNALFYHYIAEGDRENAEIHRGRLEESLNGYAIVPSFIRDTRVWGDFFLSGTSSTIEQVDAWLKELDIIYNSADMTPFEKELVQMHRIAVSSHRSQTVRLQAKGDPKIHV